MPLQRPIYRCFRKYVLFTKKQHKNAEHIVFNSVSKVLIILFIFSLNNIYFYKYVKGIEILFIFVPSNRKRFFRG